MTILAFNGKEKAYVSRYTETHYTSTQMCRKYGFSKETLLKRIPPPDVVSPYGNKTRLWERDKIIEILGEGAK